ncbi:MULTISPECIES: hypothetical protein [unclassified Caulobacter]|jgi:hypothetical protein|uniref:hypothetical protein n=1 Tax=unclassified Caulobacter TaxID=2648921 RepID=UPI0006F3A91E|nr:MULTISPECIES: hypothetical protein [unclassified Caulobacter]KQV57005.1 hypothetical protein ASC62_12015 [Caulobacter sp. Root342]KQV66491.1 hypothetical protein ASC70_11665 [Caulobacter sp. Root343]
MRKLLLSAAALLVGVAMAGSASATAYDFVIFKNNSPSTWTKSNETMSGGTWATIPPSSNPAGGTKSGYYTAPNKAPTSYSVRWTDSSDGTSCTFSSYAYQNSFGNMAFSSSVTTAGPRAASVICVGAVPSTSNLDGSYDFNMSAGY